MNLDFYLQKQFCEDCQLDSAYEAAARQLFGPQTR